MIIYQNGLLTLEYDPATDILFVAWPDIQHVVLPEIREALKVLVENIKNYDIKRLLIDSSQANVDLQGEEYKDVLKEFATNLMTTTRLQKMARVSTTDKNREQLVEEARKEIHLTVLLKSFSNRKEATDWLKA